MLQRKNRFRHESLQDTKTIQAYLKAILRGLDQGELVFSDDEGSITLKPQGLLNFKVVASEDVDKPEDLDSVRRALQEVHAGTATAIFLEPPSTHEAAAMIREYDGCPVTDEAENRLLQSGIFPFDLIARPSFSFWEGTAHSVKAHPIFKGLPTDCLMDEPYQEVAPAESFYELNAEEAPAHSITWYQPEKIATKTE